MNSQENPVNIFIGKKMLDALSTFGKGSFLFFLLLFIQFLCFSCGGEKATKQKINKLTIAVAANVQFAIKEIETAYEKTFKTDITIILGSSGKLTAQIKQGAPYDLLIAANEKYPANLYQDGYAITKPKIYALGALVLWTIKEDLDLTKGLSLLEDASIHKIAIANPKNAPYGEQAINSFKYYKLYEAILPKLVYAENIAQTNQYILTQNCEVGITAKSIVLAPGMDGKGKWIAVPLASYQPIQQSAVITKYGASNNGEQAKLFYNFLFSEEAGRIFERYGYTGMVSSK